jgi:hypothetical protein
MSDHRYSLPRAHVLAVRGHLTADRIGAPAECALGDPGILLARYLAAPTKRWDIALVPHGHHRQHQVFLSLARTTGHSVRVVNVHQSAHRAAQQIGSARVVITTSLHGLITADSFGIPAVWTTLEPALGGGNFKFRDYESVITPGRSRFVPFEAGMRLQEFVSSAWAAQRDTVAASGDALVSALERLPDVVEVGPFPRGVIDVLRHV